VTTPLRVLFVVESGTDVRLVEGLSSRCALTVVARRIEGGREISQLTDSRFGFVRGPGDFVSFARFVFGWILRHRRDVDAIVLQGYGLAALAGNLGARAIGTPALMLVCSPTEAYYRCRRLAGGGKPYRAVEALAIRVLARLNALTGQRYAVLSPYLASIVRGHGTQRPVHVAPVYGVDTRLFAPSREPRQTIRARLALPLEAALVFFSSRIAPEKDPDTLLAAVGLLRREGRDVRVLHLSGGYRELLERADRCDLASAVIARDAIPPFTRLADWYQASDACVQASREEGLGFSPLEALACGVPVVAASVGGLRDTIRDGDTGWSYPVGDADALARALREALDDPVEARRRAMRGREMVCASYERSLVFDALLDALAPRRDGSTVAEEHPRALAG
jgi:D-inositol-3-phosphate glycosyltransferase